MALDQSAILEVYPPSFRAGQMELRWRSSAPGNYWHQVYVAGVLAWYGRGTTAVLDPPDGHARVDIGAVPDGEQATDYSGSLTTPAANRARLTWSFDPALAPDVAGFRVYGESSPGLGISYASPLGTVAAGDAASGVGSYSWTSDPLSRGTWAFAVRSYDSAGNEANGSTASVAIAAPPRPPAADSAGRRLTYTYDAGTNTVTLGWLASPG